MSPGKEGTPVGSTYVAIIAAGLLAAGSFIGFGLVEHDRRSITTGAVIAVGTIIVVALVAIATLATR
jgi:hypothetical protein